MIGRKQMQLNKGRDMSTTGTDLFDNPMGLMGFEFVEFASPTPGLLEPIFERMGFSLVAKHRSKDVVLYRQGDINFIINREPKSVAGYFAAEHGPCACGMAFRVKDSHHAYRRALELGAQPIELNPGPMELNLPAIKGIGGAPLYIRKRNALGIIPVVVGGFGSQGVIVVPGAFRAAAVEVNDFEVAGAFAQRGRGFPGAAYRVIRYR